MSKTKKEFKLFTVAEYEKEQEYLREMHKHGWKLHHVAEIGMYHFEECEPEEVVYQLDYNPDRHKSVVVTELIFPPYFPVFYTNNSISPNHPYPYYLPLL